MRNYVRKREERGGTVGKRAGGGVDRRAGLEGGEQGEGKRRRVNEKIKMEECGEYFRGLLGG